MAKAVKQKQALENEPNTSTKENSMSDVATNETAAVETPKVKKSRKGQPAVRRPVGALVALTLDGKLTSLQTSKDAFMLIDELDKAKASGQYQDVQLIRINV